MGLKDYYYCSSNTTFKFDFYVGIEEEKEIKTRLPGNV
jgi:hypothetical protein